MTGEYIAGNSFLSLRSSNDFDNNRLRNIPLDEIDDPVGHLDSYRPSLRANIQNLTPLLFSLIKDRPLPDQRLCLEMLIESQIASGEHATKSLEELLNSLMSARSS
jgi:hypothetical protein